MRDAPACLLLTYSSVIVLRVICLNSFKQINYPEALHNSLMMAFSIHEETKRKRFSFGFLAIIITFKFRSFVFKLSVFNYRNSIIIYSAFKI